MIIQKISKNLKNDKLISLCSNVPFIFECFQDEKQTHWHEKPTWKHWTAKLPKLCDSFTMVLHKTAAFYTEQCTSPSLFHNFQVSQGSSNQSLKNYGFISNTIFKNCRRCTNHLATKQLLFKIVELEKISGVHEDMERLWHPLLTQCFKKRLLN